MGGLAPVGYRQRRHDVPRFQPGDRGLGQASAFTQLLLGESEFSPQPTHVLAELESPLCGLVSRLRTGLGHPASAQFTPAIAYAIFARATSRRSRIRDLLKP